MDSKYTIYTKIKRLLSFVTCIVVLYFAWCFISSAFPSDKIFYFNGTASVPRGLYMKAFNERPFQKGDYVVFYPNEETLNIALKREYIASAETLFLKKIGALPGDRYCIDPYNRQFKINNQYIGMAYQVDSKGRELPQLHGCYEVPSGDFLPIGTNPRSFDGRYTQTVPLTNIVCRVIPIITEW